MFNFSHFGQGMAWTESASDAMRSVVGSIVIGMTVLPISDNKESRGHLCGYMLDMKHDVRGTWVVLAGERKEC